MKKVNLTVFSTKQRPQEIFMKKTLLGIIPILLLTLGLAVCSAMGKKAESLSMIYGAAAVISLILLIGCIYLVRQRRQWFILLFSSVLVVNIGYTFLSVSPSLEAALWANRLSYLGSVFLPFSMLMIILGVTNTEYKRWLPHSLLGITVIIFLIAASPGILDIYYREVSFTVVNGVSTLVKEYGVLHPLYLVYLLGYFCAMVGVIIRASVKKAIDTTSHAVIIAIAVFVNIGVWFIEQLTDMEFEFLSISYIISELFLMGVHLVMKEHERLKELLAQKDEALSAIRKTADQKAYQSVSAEEIEYFSKGLETLTPTEREIYNFYLNGMSTKEIMGTLGIKENTLKFHNKNLYGKLGVSSRKHLLLVCRAIKAAKMD